MKFTAKRRRHGSRCRKFPPSESLKRNIFILFVLYNVATAFKVFSNLRFNLNITELYTGFPGRKRRQTQRQSETRVYFVDVWTGVRTRGLLYVNSSECLENVCNFVIIENTTDSILGTPCYRP